MSLLARSESRDGYGVRVLAVHTTEGGGTAAALRDADWWTGSAHAIADEDALLTPAEGCVPYDQASWTLRSGNRWSENIELVAMAGWTRPQWLAKPGLLDNCARWLADRSKARAIPLVKITAAQYRAGASGVIGHVDHTVGYSDGTHWDPGPNFPWDVVIPKAVAYRAGVTVTPVIDPRGPEMRLKHVNEKGHAYHNRIYAVTDHAVDWITDPAISAALESVWGEPEDVSARQIDLAAFDANARRARHRREIAVDVAKQVSGTDVDEQAIGQLVLAGLLPDMTAAVAALAERPGVTREDVEQVVRGVFADAAKSS